MAIMQMLLGSGSSYQVTAENVAGSASGPAPSGTVSTSGDQPNTATTGGSGGNDYVWSHVSTSSGTTPVINNAVLSNPTWSGTVSDGTNSSSVWKVTATDGVGRTAETTITVILSWSNNA